MKQCDVFIVFELRTLCMYYINIKYCLDNQKVRGPPNKEDISLPAAFLSSSSFLPPELLLAPDELVEFFLPPTIPDEVPPSLLPSSILR